MSITDTVSQVAASNPVVGVALASAQTEGGILGGLQGGDTSVSSLLDAINGRTQQVSDLISQLQPNLGQNVNTQA